MADETHAHLTGAGEFDCAPEPLPTLRHSTSHVMAQAVKQLFPGVKLAIGPAIEDGFYYDFHRAEPFTPEDLGRIEERMREIAQGGLSVRARGGSARGRDPRSSASGASRSRSRSSRACRPTWPGCRSTGRATSSTSAAARTCRPPARSRPSSCSRPPAPTGGATRRTRCSSASTGRPGSPRRSSTSTSGASRRRRSATTASSAASSTCSTFHDVSPGRAVLAAQGHGGVPRARAVRARAAGRARLPGDLDADPREQEALGAVGALGALPGQHVQGRGRGADLQPQADELPGVHLTSTGTRCARTATCRSASPRWGGSTATSARAR